MTIEAENNRNRRNEQTETTVHTEIHASGSETSSLTPYSSARIRNLRFFIVQNCRLHNLTHHQHPQSREIISSVCTLSTKNEWLAESISLSLSLSLSLLSHTTPNQRVLCFSLSFYTLFRAISDIKSFLHFLRGSANFVFRILVLIVRTRLGRTELPAVWFILWYDQQICSICAGTPLLSRWPTACGTCTAHAFRIYSTASTSTILNLLPTPPNLSAVNHRSWLRQPRRDISLSQKVNLIFSFCARWQKKIGGWA